jgi:threonyl-tRNA synthetase
MLPLWLAPTQVRLAPVSREHLDLAGDLADLLERAPVRVDVDDRDGTIGWKVRQAEQEWVPYIVVLGDRERAAGTVPVRSRSERRQLSLSPEALAAMILDQVRQLPYRPLPLPRCLSQRPSYAG